MKSELKKFVLAAGLVVAGLAAQDAGAMTIAQPGLAASSPIEQAAFGCGPGWHPNPWGRCVPNRRVFVHRRHCDRWGRCW